MTDKLTALAWRVRYSEHSQQTTLAMLKGLPFGIMLTHGTDGVDDHYSEELGSEAEAEEFLLTATRSAGAEMVLPPTEFVVNHLPYVEVQDSRFKEWVEDEVLKAVDLEILKRQLASVTFTFGKPQPAFTR